MAGPRLIGEAFIPVLPQTDGFREQLDSKIRAAIGSLSPDVAIGANTKDALAKVAALRKVIESEKNADIQLGLGTASFYIERSAIDASIEELRKKLNMIPITADDTQTISKIYSIAAQVEDLQARLKGLKGDIEAEPAMAKLYDITAQVEELQQKTDHLDFDFDISKALDKQAQIRAVLDTIREEARNMDIDADDTQMNAKLASVLVKTEALSKELKYMPMDADTLPFEAKVLQLDAQVDKLKSQIKSMPADFSESDALDKLIELQTIIDKVRADLKDIPIDADDTPMNAKLMAIQAKTNTLEHELDNIPLDADATPLEAKLLALKASAEALDNSIKKVGEDVADSTKENIGSDPFGLALADFAAKKLNADLETMEQGGHGVKLSAEMKNLSDAIAMAKEQAEQFNDHPIANATEAAAVQALASKVGSLRAAFDAAQNSSALAGGAWQTGINILSKGIPLFDDIVGQTYRWGTALAGTEKQLPALVNHLFSMTNGWHLAIEAVVEFTAIWAPATIAATAFGVAAIAGAKAIYTQYTNVNTVINATGQTVNGLSGGISDFQKAAIPALTSVEGAFINISNSGSNTMAPAIKAVGNVIQDFAAKITAAMTNSSGGFGKFVQKSSQDIAYLGDSFDQLGRIFSTLLKDASASGYAEKLIQVGNAALSVAADVLKAGQPIIALGIKLHGAFFYLGLAGTLVAKFGGTLGSVFSGAVTKSSGLVSKLGTGIANMGIAMSGSEGKVGQLGEKLFNVGAATEEGSSMMTKFGGAMSGLPWGLIVMGATAAGIGIYYLIKAITENDDAARKLGTDFVNAMNSITTSSQANQLVVQDLGKVYTMYHNDANAAAQANKIMKNSQDEVSQSAAVGVSTYTANSEALAQNQKQMRELIGDATNMMTSQVRMNEVVTEGSKAFGSQTGFLDAWQNAGLKVGDLATANASKLKQDTAQLLNYTLGLQANMQQSKATGNAVAALTIQSSAQVQAVTSLNSAWKAFITAVTGGESSMLTFTKSLQTVKSDAHATGASMTGLNTNSQQLRSDWDSLVSNGDSLIESLKTQAATAGNTAKAQSLLENGSKAVIAQMIPLASTSKTAQAELYALAQEAGYTGSNSLAQLTKWAGNSKDASDRLNTAVNGLTQQMDDANKDAEKLIGSLLQLANSAFTAAIEKTSGMQQSIQSFAAALVDSNGKMTTLVANAGVNLVNAMVKSGMSVSAAKSQIDNWMTSMHMGSSAINEMNSLIDSMNGKTAVSQQRFQTFAEKLGLSKSQSDALYSSLNKLNTTVHAQVDEKISGSGKISLSSSMPGVGIYTSGAAQQAQQNSKSSPQSFVNALSHSASGGYVGGHGGPAQDNHPAMLSSGEFVLNAAATKHVGVDTLNRVNKMPKAYATGGAVPGVPTVALSGSYGADAAMNADVMPTTQNVVNQAVQETTQALVTAAQSAMAGAAANVSSAGEMANAKTIFNYLIHNGFTKIAAAGAIASLVGESSLNPEAREAGGGGGEGIAQWTGSSQSAAMGFTALTGNASRDLSAQLPGLIRLANASDPGAIAAMNKATSVLQAANIWGRDVERYGVNDVHAAGISIGNMLVAQSGNSSGSSGSSGQFAGGPNKPNSTGGVISEPVYGVGKFSGQSYSFAERGPETVLSASQSALMGANGSTQLTIPLLQQMIKEVQKQTQVIQQQPQQNARYARNANAAARVWG